MIISALLAFVTAAMWGLQEVLDKLALNSIKPITSLLVKGTITGVIASILFICFFKQIKQDIFPKNKLIKLNGIFLTLLAAASASAALMIMLFNLNHNKNIHIIVAIAYTSPLFTILFSKLFIKGIEITTKQVVSISIITIGVIMLLTSM